MLKKEQKPEAKKGLRRKHSTLEEIRGTAGELPKDMANKTPDELREIAIEDYLRQSSPELFEGRKKKKKSQPRKKVTKLDKNLSRSLQKIDLQENYYQEVMLNLKHSKPFKK